MVSCISRTCNFGLKISAKRCGLYTSFYGKLPHLAISSALLEGTFSNLLSQMKMWNTMPLWISTRECYYQSLLIFNIHTSKSLFSDWCRNKGALLPSLIVSIQIWKSMKRLEIGNKLWGHKFFPGSDNLYKCQSLSVASCQYTIEDAFFQPLSLLHPLYDIAVWQFILMSSYKAISGRESPCNTHTKSTWKMHKVVANFLCKPLEVLAFDHLQSQLLGKEVKLVTGNWKVGQIATTSVGIPIPLGTMQLTPKTSCLPYHGSITSHNHNNHIP